jgi:LysM repeat protein/flagellar biogenesis protein FliO
MRPQILFLAIWGMSTLLLSPALAEEISSAVPAETPVCAPQTTAAGEAPSPLWQNPVKDTHPAAPAQVSAANNVFSEAVPAEVKKPVVLPTQANRPGEKAAASPCYTVRNGDSLIVIAKAYGVSTAAILEANHLSSASLLRIGQILKIPGGVTPNRRLSGDGTVKEIAPHTLGGHSSAAAGLPSSAAEVSTTQSEKSNIPAPATAAPLQNSAALPLFGENSEKHAGPNLLGGAGSLFSLILKLGFVLILAYVAARAMRRFAPRAGKSRPAAPAQNNMEILETITLGPERWIHVVALGSKAYLLSSTPQQTALITEVTDTGLLQELREKQALEGGFAGQLAQLMAGDRNKRGKAGSGYPAGFFAAKMAELNPFGGGRQ